MEFGRRLAGERMLMKSTQPSCLNAVFDESGHFLIYPTIFGIKVVNTHSNKVVRLIGKSEPHRFMNVAIYQGAPKKKSMVTMVTCHFDYRKSAYILSVRKPYLLLIISIQFALVIFL